MCRVHDCPGPGATGRGRQCLRVACGYLIIREACERPCPRCSRPSLYRIITTLAYLSLLPFSFGFVPVCSMPNGRVGSRLRFSRQTLDEHVGVVECPVTA